MLLPKLAAALKSRNKNLNSNLILNSKTEKRLNINYKSSPSQNTTKKKKNFFNLERALSTILLSPSLTDSSQKGLETHQAGELQNLVVYK